jgi:hypothetical protein
MGLSLSLSYVLKDIYIYIIFLLYVVMFLLFCVARFLSSVRQCEFLFFVAFFLWSRVDVAVISWPTDV